MEPFIKNMTPPYELLEVVAPNLLEIVVGQNMRSYSYHSLNDLIDDIKFYTSIM